MQLQFLYCWLKLYCIHVHLFELPATERSFVVRRTVNIALMMHRWIRIYSDIHNIPLIDLHYNHSSCCSYVVHLIYSCVHSPFGHWNSRLRSYVFSHNNGPWKSIDSITWTCKHSVVLGVVIPYVGDHWSKKLGCGLDLVPTHRQACTHKMPYLELNDKEVFWGFWTFI